MPGIHTKHKVVTVTVGGHIWYPMTTYCDLWCSMEFAFPCLFSYCIAHKGMILLLCATNRKAVLQHLEIEAKCMTNLKTTFMLSWKLCNCSHFNALCFGKAKLNRVCQWQ